MQFATTNRDKLIRLYTEEHLSLDDIAKKLGASKNMVYRAMKFLNVPLRSKSEAQKLAIKEGRRVNPTEGKERTPEEKEAISKKMRDHWQELPEEELERRAEVCRENWHNRTDEQKREFAKRSTAGIQVSAKEGSKMERAIRDGLAQAGFSSTQHRQFLENENLEVDILVPRLNTVIEVDGPSHFMPIWGEEAFAKTQQSDRQKNLLLIGRDYCVIRVACKYKTLTDAKIREAIDMVVEELNKIEKKRPKKQDRLIEVEVV